MTKINNSISHSRSRGVVLLLCGLLLGVACLFAEETVASCRMACHNRYKAYYNDCWVSYYMGNIDSIDKCVETVNLLIANCSAACGDI